MFASRSVVIPFRMNGFWARDSSMMAIDVLRIMLLFYVLYIIISKLVKHEILLMIVASALMEILRRS